IVLLGGKQCSGHHGIEWEFGHSSTKSRQLAHVIQCAQCIELFQCNHQRLRRGWVKVVKMNNVVNSKTFEHEHYISQVNTLNFGHSVLLEFGLKGPSSEQSEAFASSNTTRSTSSL